MARTATQIWCPNCKTIRPCHSVKATDWGDQATGRWFRTDHEDIRWFGRIRVCQECGTDFRTAEIEEKFLDELIELRDALAELKAHGADVESGVADTSKRLKRLSKALSGLRALT